MKVIVKIYPKKNRVSGSGSINLPEKFGFSGFRYGFGYTKPEPEPEGTSWPLSTYFNHHWKYLTKTAIRLKIFFKENLTDIKRVTGIKYIALVLGGYFQIRLLVDDVSDQCPDAGKRAELESFKTSQEMTLCRRGLLPLLTRKPLLDLIKAIIQMDRQTGTNYGDPVPIILKILGFLFSIKVKDTVMMKYKKHATSLHFLLDKGF